MAPWSLMVPERVHLKPWLRRGARLGLGNDGCDSPGGGGGAVVSGTPCRHPGHCCIAVRAWLRRSNEWLVAATRHWHESAG